MRPNMEPNMAPDMRSGMGKKRPIWVIIGLVVVVVAIVLLMNSLQKPTPNPVRSDVGTGAEGVAPYSSSQSSQ